MTVLHPFNLFILVASPLWGERQNHQEFVAVSRFLSRLGKVAKVGHLDNILRDLSRCRVFCRALLSRFCRAFVALLSRLRKAALIERLRQLAFLMVHMFGALG